MNAETQMRAQSQTVSRARETDRIADFISSQVTGRGLDERTEKAYRQDLEHFYIWLSQGSEDKLQAEEGRDWETKMK